MTVHRYTCAKCGGEFESDRSDDEAKGERARYFGTPYQADDALICHDCWLQFMAWFAELG